MTKLHAVFSRYPEVEQAILYGSRAKGNYRPGSDIDLILKGPQLSPRILCQIQDNLEDGPLPYRVDLSIFAQITHAELVTHIERVGIVFYDRSVHR